MVEILCTNVWKWKNETCWNYSKNGGRGIKENDGGDEFKIYYKYFCKCHNVPPVQQWYDNKKTKRYLMKRYDN
jgi:hypothetical protein